MKKLYLVLLTIGVLLQNSFLQAQIITTVAGTGVWGYNGDGIVATAAKINNAPRIAVDACGNIFIGDAANHRVRKVDVRSGLISTVAGTGVAGYNGDGGLADTSKLNTPVCLAFDNLGNLYIGDGNNHRIRKVDALTGIITTVVGNGVLGFSADGLPATAGPMSGGDFVFDPFGNMYMCDIHRIRKIDSSGILHTIAGTGLSGLVLDGVPATTSVVTPWPAINTDIYGNVFFSDTCGSIRKVTVSTGIISRVAGSGVSVGSYTGDGTIATACYMNPCGLCIDSIGNIYTACYTNNRCIMIDTFGITHTIAGTGIAGFSGEGAPATNAKLWYPKDIKLDNFGHVLIADWNNSRVRKITYPYSSYTSSISLSGVSFAPLGTSVTITATIVGVGSSYTVHWLNRGIEFATTTAPSVTYIKPPGTDTITARVVPSSTLGCYDSAVSVFHLVYDNALSSTTVFANSSGISIYPNPTTNLLHITGLPGAATYRLLSMVGAVARCGELPAGGGAASLQGLPTGMYVLELVTERGERVVRRVVKE